jgi:adenylosuccinate synthase
MIRYAHRINRFSALCLTKLDCLDGFAELQVAAAYRDPASGAVLADFPAEQERLERVAVDYERFDGWLADTAACRSFADLPPAAQRYVRGLERLCGVPVKWVGVGQSREAVIELF